MAFDYCCDSPNKIAYTLHHATLNTYDIVKLSNLLWYLPEIDSFQAEHGTPLSDDVYEDVYLDLIKRELHLSDDDLKIDDTHSDHTIDDADAQYYENQICTNCSKVIVAKSKGKNKVVSLLSHIRNSIAHGYFNIVDNVFIGFDHPKYGGVKYTGVVKVKTDNLFSLSDKLNDALDLPSLYKTVLVKFLGYIADINPNRSGDLFIQKDGRKYYLEFKKFRGRYINKDDLEEYVRARDYIDKSDCTFVLVVDSTYTTQKINSFLVEHNICVLDKKWVKELIRGNDVFEELTKLREQFVR